MSSSYSKGKRIALDNLVKEDNYVELKKIVPDIVGKCGKDVSISTHFIQTDSEDWKSVTEKDYFFKDVEVIESKEDFIKLIQKDRKLNGLDVAKYILSKIKCTHLKLEKLVYLCFTEYLCKYDKELFNYKKYKSIRYKEIEANDEDIDSTGIMEMPSRSRILFAEDGIEKIKSIDETLEKYGMLSARELTNLQI